MNLSKYIDHTLLKPDTTTLQIKTLCEEAIQNQFYAVCVNSSWIPLCSSILNGSKVKIASVVGFPLGVLSTKAKGFETADAVKMGAEEIDMVIHIGQLKDKNFSYVENDIREVVKAAEGKSVKVILETTMLSQEEKKIACELSLNAKAHFVKTCTGFGGGGATVEDIQLMKSIVKDQMEIKASGGIKTAEFALQLIQAGATRLGTSSGVALVQNLKINPGSY